ncbi:Synaptonemal complex protein zep1 [Trebouxia sp. C0010 RCD-2024]
MASFTQLPMANASFSSLLDSRPCCIQRCFQSRPAAGSNLMWKPFHTPNTLTTTRVARSSTRKLLCQAIIAPPSPASTSQNGSGGHSSAPTDHPIDNKSQQTGPKILIAGAGIGGLVLAVGLLKRGFDVKVFEKNITAIRGEGKYRGPIQVQSNALAALEAIDKEMADKILAEGCITGDRINGLVDGATGKWYVKFDTFHPAVDRGLPVTRVISRVVLQQLLAETAISMAGEDVILNDQNVVDYQHEVDDMGKRRVWAVMKSGDRWEGDILVGADGIYSKVRQKLVGNGQPTYSEYTCYTGIADFTPPDIDTVGYRVFLGNGRYFVSSDVGGGKMQWYGFHKEPAGGQDIDGQRKQRLLTIFGDWTDMVTDLIRATPECDVLRRDIFDRPPVFKWTKGNVILLGDSAHAMQPNLGQGGCMAIEDAFQLAKDLYLETKDFKEPYFNLERILVAFQRKRFIRSSTIHGLAGSAAIMASTYKAHLGEGLGPLKPYLTKFKIPHPGRVGGYFAMNLTMPTVLAWVLGGNVSNLEGARSAFCRMADQPKGFKEKDFRTFLKDDDALIRASKASWLLQPMTATLHLHADDEDEYIGSLDLCSIDEDYDENCDVTAVDRFHGLRVAHPIEAHTLGQGITVGRDASCGIVLDEPSVSQQHAEITRKENGEYFLKDLGSTKGTWCNAKQLKPNQEIKLHPEDKLYFGSKSLSSTFKVKLAHESVEKQLRKYIGEMEAAKKEESALSGSEKSGSENLAGAAF